MAPPKKNKLRVLSDAHLRAIGRVAAQWSALEITLLWTLARVAGVPFRNGVIMGGSQNASGICDMLQKLTGDTYPAGTGTRASRATALDKLAIKVAELMPKRNGIVHGVWHPRQEIQESLLEFAKASRPKGSDRIAAVGIPKKGNKVFSGSAYTSGEIIAIADEIADTEQAVFLWIARWIETKRLVGAIEKIAGPHPPVRNLGFGARRSLELPLIGEAPNMGLLKGPLG